MPVNRCLQIMRPLFFFLFFSFFPFREGTTTQERVKERSTQRAGLEEVCEMMRALTNESRGVRVPPSHRAELLLFDQPTAR